MVKLFARESKEKLNCLRPLTFRSEIVDTITVFIMQMIESLRGKSFICLYYHFDCGNRNVGSSHMRFQLIWSNVCFARSRPYLGYSFFREVLQLRSHIETLTWNRN